MVFSNAALHWVPDHAGVLARWTESLRPRGQLAVQVPTNVDHASHLVAAAEVAHEQPFLERSGRRRRRRMPSRTTSLRPERYAELLDRLGFAEQHVRLQVYGHHLAVHRRRGRVGEGHQPHPLPARRWPPTLFEQFVRPLPRTPLGVLGEQAPYFYAFKRILLWGRRPA